MRDASEVSTTKIYYEDPYAEEFTAKVLSYHNGDLVLDRTCFFPEEGGQSPDAGTIAGFRAEDVQIKDGEIHHRITLPEGACAPEPGETVSGKIDWAHRFSNMQQHSGEHIFSGIIHKKYGFDNVGFHLSDSEVTLDFNGVVPEEGIEEAEWRANEVIAENLEIQVLFPTRGELDKMDYRSKLELSGDVRVVVIPGIDACACCAPHVRRTSEIGLLKVISCQNYKGGVRISILCGLRAARLFIKEHDILAKTANYLTTSPDEIYNLTVKAKSENAALKSALRKAAAAEIQTKIDGIEGGGGNVCIFQEELDTAVARGAVNNLVEKTSGFCGIFVGNTEEGYKYIIGKKGGDARQFSKILNEKYGARGGGQPSMVQGSVKAPEEEIRELFQSSASESCS